MSDFEKMMLDLKNEYISEIPLKLKEIRAHLDAEDFSALQDDFHKLKGTGTTYSVPEVSDLGEVVEAICRDITEMAPQAVLSALEILANIHKQRLDSKPYEISNDKSFCHLKQVLANPSKFA